uniref:Prostacyclin receptor-like isoform X2 n=1 Tax=Crassostrea virginica TaxID=6565 RepID=A0A8B8E8S0_CRAVI|nr:prostacyclin receptor-like isoform X2 [Crassostrea virginica]
MNGSNSSVDTVSESWVPPVLQFLFGVVGNSAALLILVCNSPTHKWSPFYRLVGGLALTDGVGILFLYPPILARYATNFTFHFTNSVCAYTSFLASFTIISSALIVCAMSIDRCLAIYFPFCYKNGNGDKLRGTTLILVIWVTGTVVSGFQLMGLGSVYKFYPATLHNKHPGHFSRVRKDVYNIAFLSVIVVLSCICWTPLMWRIVGVSCHLSPPDPDTELLVLRLAVTNSIVDPWVYILLRRETLTYIHKMMTKGQTNNDVQHQSSRS